MFRFPNVFGDLGPKIWCSRGRNEMWVVRKLPSPQTHPRLCQWYFSVRDPQISHMVKNFLSSRLWWRRWPHRQNSAAASRLQPVGGVTLHIHKPLSRIQLLCAQRCGTESINNNPHNPHLHIRLKEAVQSLSLCLINSPNHTWTDRQGASLRWLCERVDTHFSGSETSPRALPRC